MTTRRASCDCGKLHVECEGEPVRVSVCYCTSCQRRTGSAFGAQARFARADVKTEGPSTSYVRIADEGNRITFNFCASCGTTLYWENEGVPGFIAVALGGFADATFPEPTVTVYDARRASWVPPLTGAGVTHLD